VILFLESQVVVRIRRAVHSTISRFHCHCQWQPSAPRYDNTYDNSQGSVNGVGCSDGEHGLAARFSTFGGNLPSSHIGGVFGIAWNSPNCGACWKITNKANNAAILYYRHRRFQGVNTALNGSQLENDLTVEGQRVGSCFLLTRIRMSSSLRLIIGRIYFVLMRFLSVLLVSFP
jgi:hypothetical protein